MLFYPVICYGRKNKLSRKKVRIIMSKSNRTRFLPTTAAIHILQWGLFPIYACLAGIFCSAESGAPLTLVEAGRLENALEMVLASLILLTAGSIAADLATRDR